MRIKSLFFASAVLATVLTGCNKEEHAGGVSENTRAVRIQFTQDGTRAEGDPVAAGTALTLGEGHLYFTSGSLITKYMTISSSPTAGNNLNIATLTGASGEVVADVPDNSTQVILLSNLPAGVTPPTTSSIPVETLKAVQIEAAKMGAANGSVSAVTLYGQGTIGPNISGDPDDPQQVEVEVRAIASRLEIAKITGDGQVSDFKVAGIYINNYYEKTSVDGVTGTNAVDHGSDAAKYVAAATPGSGYAADVNKSLHDAFATPLDNTALSVVPATSGKSWAYHVLPTTAATPEPLMPHIVIILEDVKVGSATLTGPQYLTVKGFSESGISITKLEKGVIYKVNEIKFTEENITDRPEVEAFSVEVKLDMIPWTAKAVEAEW